jgi:hypothetical protein
MHRVAFATLLLALPGLAHAACKKPVSAAELQTTLDTAEAAYGRVDIDAFNGAMEKARKQVVCITEEITPSLAAELHRLEGMYAFANSARDKAMAAFAAARALEPDYAFPTNIVPPGNPLLEHYTAKDPVCEEERIPPAKDGKVRVDGGGQRKLPTEFPAIVQVLDPKGGDDITQYHWPGDPLPYEAGTLRTPVQTGLLVGGTAVAVAGVATMLFGQASTSTSTDDFPSDILAASRQRSALTGTGAGLTTAGLAAIGVSFVLPNKDAAQ